MTSARWPRGRRARAAAGVAGARDAVLHMLAGEGCVICRQRAESERHWLFAFIEETHVEPEVVASVRATLGFCPAHTRALLTNLSAPWLLLSVGRTSCAAAIDHVRRPPRDRRSPARCPTCLSMDRMQHTVTVTLLHALDGVSDAEPVVSRLRAVGGLCLSHTLDVARRADPDAARLLTQACRARLGDPDPEVRRRALAGEDLDDHRRFPLLASRSVAEGGEAEAGSTLAALHEALRADQCLACAAAGDAAVRFLRWLGQPAGSHAPTPEEAQLCPAHLADLTVLAPGADWVPQALGDRWGAELDRLVTVVDTLARDGRPARLLRALLGLSGEGEGRRSYAELVRAAWRSPAARSRDAAARAWSHRSCRACTAAAVAATRRLELLRAALGDRPTRQLYQDEHGLCLAHATSARWPDPVLPVLLTRLGTVVWELAEALRKSRWDARHERRGPESGVWARFPTLIDGSTYLGLSPTPVRPGGGGWQGAPPGAPGLVGDDTEGGRAAPGHPAAAPSDGQQRPP